MQRPPVDWRQRGCIVVVCIYIYIFVYLLNYPTCSNKCFDGLPLEIDTHRHFPTSTSISELVRIFVKIYYVIHTMFG